MCMQCEIDDLRGLPERPCPDDVSEDTQEMTVLDWIEAWTDEPLTPWQRRVIEAVFDVDRPILGRETAGIPDP